MFLKKFTMDEESISSWRSVFNLDFLSSLKEKLMDEKITEQYLQGYDLFLTT